MKDPKTPAEQLNIYFTGLCDEIQNEIRKLLD